MRDGEARNQNDLNYGLHNLDGFEKKYKDKTGNEWGRIESFKPKKKKYTRIQIDNEVQVSDDFKVTTGGAEPETNLEMSSTFHRS